MLAPHSHSNTQKWCSHPSSPRPPLIIFTFCSCKQSHNHSKCLWLLLLQSFSCGTRKKTFHPFKNLFIDDTCPSVKTLQTQCDLEQTNSFFQVFYSYFVDQSCEPFIQSSDYREALSFCTTRSVFGLHHRRIFRNRFRSISEEEWTAAQTFLLSHTLLKLKVLHNTTSLIKYPNINPAYDQMFKPKKTQLLQSWSIHDHLSSEQTVWKEFLLHLQLENFTFSLTGLANF